MEANYLLSEEFLEFSQKIAEIYAQQKAKKEKMKKLWEVFKAEEKELEEEALRLYEEFEGLKSGNVIAAAENCHCDHTDEKV